MRAFKRAIRINESFPSGRVSGKYKFHALNLARGAVCASRGEIWHAAHIPCGALSEFQSCLGDITDDRGPDPTTVAFNPLKRAIYRLDKLRD